MLWCQALERSLAEAAAALRERERRAREEQERRRQEVRGRHAWGPFLGSFSGRMT